jgi:hypothetical protein
MARAILERTPRIKRALLHVYRAMFGERDEWRRQAHFWKYYADLYEWRWRATAAELWGEPIRPPPPIRYLPPELRDAFTMDGRIAVNEQWADGTHPQNHPLIYTDAEIDACITRIRRGETSIYTETDTLLWAAFARYPIRNKSVAVMGSISPWYEATCIYFDARPTTIDYNPIISKTPRLDATTVMKWSRLSEQNFRVDKWSLCRG